MLKVIGILVLISVCIAFGFYQANKLGVRQKRLLSIYNFINEASEKIRVGEEMKKIIEKYGTAAGIYKKGYDLYIGEDGLSVGDISLANEFLSGLGMGDTEYELKRCENYSRLFKKALTVAESETKEKASVYRKLGVFAGLLIGIVLI